MPLHRLEGLTAPALPPRLASKRFAPGGDIDQVAEELAQQVCYELNVNCKSFKMIFIDLIVTKCELTRLGRTLDYDGTRALRGLNREVVAMGKDPTSRRYP